MEVLDPVESLIDKVKENRSKKLNLSNLKLTKLPKEVFDLPCVKEIDLRGNPDISIDSLKRLNDLPALETIYFSKKEIDAIKPRIGEFFNEAI